MSEEHPPRTTTAQAANEEPGRLEVREVWGADPSALIYAAAAASAGGDLPEDQAILRFAAEQGVLARDIERRRPKVRVNPGGTRGRKSTFREDGVLYVQGEVESVLPLCPGDTASAAEAAAQMAARGLRVLAAATGSSQREENLTLWGLIGLSGSAR